MPNSFGPLAGLIEVETGQHHQEFVAAHVTEKLAIFKTALKLLSDALYQLVSGAMAQGGDDAAEPVDRQTQHDKGFSHRDGFPEVLQQEVPIGQARQAVVMGLVDDSLLALGDGFLHRVESVRQLCQLGTTANVNRLAVDTLSHPAGSRDEIPHGASDRSGQPEAATEGEDQ